MFSDIMNTPVGNLLIQASVQGITEVDFTDADNSKVHRNKLTSRCKRQLQEYFESKRKSFDLPLDLRGTTFQRLVWARLSSIPFGQAVSYRDIANLLSKPKAVRAVGAANGKNPVAIIVPCHRVIGADRTLTGYAGGLHRKAWLLEHEGIAFKSVPESHLSDSQQYPQADLFE